MDPINNPTPTPNPAPTPGVPPVAPVPPVQPTTPVQAVPTNPVTPTSTAPVTPVNPIVQPGPKPVNPVINPTTAGANPAPASSAFQSASLNGVAATEPIMRPEPVSAPDPVEEELKAPMKAAAPVPGSIGSAVSGPEITEEPAPELASVGDSFVQTPQGNTPSVSFTDPATQPEVNPQAQNPVKKKSSKTTLIILIVVALMVVIALAAVFIFQLMNNGEQQKPITPTPAPERYEDSDEPDDDKESDSNTVGTSETLVCTANKTTLDQVATESGQNVKSSTLTLNFSEGKLTGVVINAVVVDSNGGEQEITSKLTTSQFFAQAGISTDDLKEQGVEVDEDGNVIASKDQILNTGVDGYICANPSRQ